MGGGDVIAWLRKVWFAAWSLGLTAAAGCASVETTFDPRMVEDLKEGHPRTEVQRRFGKPTTSETGVSGVVLDRYRRSALTVGDPLRAVRNSGQLEVQSLDILYSPRGVVHCFRFSEGKLPVEADRFEFRGGHRIAPDQAGRIRRGVTTRDNLVGWFGNPMLEGLTLEGSTTLHWFFVSGPQPNTLEGEELIVLLDRADRVAGFRLIRSKL